MCVCVCVCTSRARISPLFDLKILKVEELELILCIKQLTMSFFWCGKF
jgi:hypothetical protein